ncbi:hypothetical protein Sipo8835_24725 [Streptomyces ipomoeae]|uniref:Protein TolB n=1 Tax=Streptomyces ipomoeae TaxID=103232 RepID=A0AAE8W0R0_9ACTN|nr:hypothetical protein [Streptomyces ipomoeae]TQE29486.1 hypothetical protein Sipo8835_24725 [Streptomyces ipomoeae]TQE34269.1 hypothetical protein Sipo7851_18545 [Streptomyces ipomoeae]
MRHLTSLAALTAALILTALPTASAHTPGVQRISTVGDGGQLPSASTGARISADGRYAVFNSADPTGGYDRRVYIKDLRTGGLTPVPEEMQYTGEAMISGDGRRIAYNNGNRFPHPYVYDRVTGETQQLWPERAPDDTLYELGTVGAISADGRHVAYVIGNRHGNQGSRVLYVRDLVTGTDEQITALPPEGMIDRVRLSADGRTVAYDVIVLTGSASGALGRVYVKDRRTGATRRVDPDPEARSVLAQLSGDGRRVLFTTTAPANGTPQPYIHDLRTGRTEPAGPEGSTAVAADPSARHVLLARDGALSLLDLRTGAHRSVTGSGTALPGAVSRQGRAVVFTSTADDLVADDTNGVADVFIQRGH